MVRNREAKPAGRRLAWRRWAGFLLLLALPVAFLAVFYFYPLGEIVRVSLAQQGDSPPVADLLARLFSSGHLRIVGFTFGQALLSTGLTLMLGLPGAYVFARYQFPGKRLIQALSTVPFVLPTVVVGDFNVIPEDKDTFSVRAMQHDALMQPASRDAYRRILNDGWTDAIDTLNPRGGVWTFWDYQAGAWQRDHGFRIDHLLGSLAPGRWADVLLAGSLDRIQPSHVFFKGELVAQDGRLVVSPPPADYPEWIHNTVTVRRGKRAEDFALRAEGPSVTARVIELYPDHIINRAGQATLPVVDGCVMPDVAQDVLKLAVVERHGRNGNIGVAFVRGFGMKQGALASSVAHDHHNIIVAGTNDDDMAACARAIEAMQGGLAIAAGGQVLGQLALPIGGLLSTAPAEEVIAGLEAITAIAHDLGCTLPAPFMTISFIGLPTVPELGLTDMGLVDVRQHALIGTLIT